MSLFWPLLPACRPEYNSLNIRPSRSESITLGQFTELRHTCGDRTNFFPAHT